MVCSLNPLVRGLKKYESCVTARCSRPKEVQLRTYRQLFLGDGSELERELPSRADLGPGQRAQAQDPAPTEQQLVHQPDPREDTF